MADKSKTHPAELTAAGTKSRSCREPKSIYFVQFDHGYFPGLSNRNLSPGFSPQWECREKDRGKQVAKKNAKGMADPTVLKPIDRQHGLLQVVIETPKGSRNKFAFDPDQRVFTLSKVLPAGMMFPYDFGFLPKTLAPDGDPFDVLLLMDEPAYPGVVVRSRLIGVIAGEQIEGKKKNRNDRLLAVAEASHQYANIKTLRDLPREFLHELEEFFVNFHRQEGKEYRLLGCKDADEAMRLIREARRAA
jgi:inorganic pyrophosphatase